MNRFWCWWKAKSLNEHLFKIPDFLNSLVGVLLTFCERQSATTGDVTQMFYQVQVLQADSNELDCYGIFQKTHSQTHTKTHNKMNVHLFGKTDSCLLHDLNLTGSCEWKTLACFFDNFLILTAKSSQSYVQSSTSNLSAGGIRKRTIT